MIRLKATYTVFSPENVHLPLGGGEIDTDGIAMFSAGALRTLTNVAQGLLSDRIAKGQFREGVYVLTITLSWDDASLFQNA